MGHELSFNGGGGSARETSRPLQTGQRVRSMPVRRRSRARKSSRAGASGGLVGAGEVAPVSRCLATSSLRLTLPGASRP